MKANFFPRSARFCFIAILISLSGGFLSAQEAGKAIEKSEPETSSLEAKEAASREQIARDEAGGYTTYNFDNCRTWAKRCPDGGDLGNDGWLRITAKGKRDYLAGIDPKRTALVIVDLQEGLYGPGSWPELLRKYNPEIADAWNKRMEDVVIPNVNRLTDFCRKNDILIVWLTLNPAAMLSQLKTNFGPREIHIVKYSAGAFATSGLDVALREFDIKTLLMVGADAPCCFMATVDGAYDRNYQTIVVEDGCIGSRQELHEAAMKIWAYRAYVRSTDQVINDYPWKKWIDPSIKEKK